jgi:hypothetical protein
MNYFRFYKNDDSNFVLTERDFVIFCQQYQNSMLSEIGENGSLPEEVDDTAFMQLKNVDELLENYFTFKFLFREYNLETPEEMEEIEDFILKLFKLGNRK